MPLFLRLFLSINPSAARRVENENFLQNTDSLPSLVLSEVEAYKSRKIMTLVLLLVGTVFLSGCSRWRHRGVSVKPRVTCKKLTGKRTLTCQFIPLTGSYLPPHLVGIEEAGYTLFVLHLQNKGPATYLFRPSYCSLPRASAHQIAQLLQYDTTSRVVWLSLPALWFCWQAIPLLIVPWGAYWSSCNSDIIAHLEQEILGPNDSLEIGPYEDLKRFVCVPTDCVSRKVGFTFFEKETKKLLSFTVFFDEVGK